MHRTPISTPTMEEPPVPTPVKLALFWTSFMLLYLYVDYLHLYMPGSLQDLLAGKVFLFRVDPLFLLIAFISVAIPPLMIVLSVTLSARYNRIVNVVVALVYIPYSLFNLAGEAWMHMWLAAVIEVGILLLIIRCAWRWPVKTLVR